MPTPRYAELHCRSAFSFLTGASHPQELVARADELGYAALALTDECSLAGAPRAHAEAKRRRFPLLVGSEMRLTRPDGAAHARLVLLAQSKPGYAGLVRWITLARGRATKGHYLAHPGDLEGAAPEAPSLTGLPGCMALLVPAPGQRPQDVLAHACWLKEFFGDRAALACELLLRPGEARLADTVEQAARASGLPVAAAGDVLMHVRSRKPLQDTLVAIRLGRPLAQCGHALAPNAEQHLRPLARLSTIYPAAWLEQTLVIADRCAGFSLDELAYEYPDELIPAGHTPISWLRALTEEGAHRRYPAGPPAAVRRQLEEELALIERLRYEPFFLTVADVVAWARGQKILCQGRGSAANSVVCWCLGITEVDPAHANLLFARFLSVERNEPPDIDVDFEHQRREEVIQYIFGKYGRHRAALAAVVICWRPRSALRDAGKALGFDLSAIDGVAKAQHWFDGRRVDPQRLRDNGFDPESPPVALWMELTQQLIGCPRHLSQHPGGFVIARKDLSDLVPVENAAMVGRSVIQWDKDDLESLGLLKVDVLALGMLSALRRALAFVGAKLGHAFSMADVPTDDAATWDMICRADTVGVFQIESRAQMGMLPRLKPRCYYDLVVEVAIVRPGPIQGGMVHPYLRNRLRPKHEIAYAHPEIERALGRTLGVPIFQEQVMQLAIHAADFTPGEADALRRAMAAWQRDGSLAPFKDRLVGRMVEKGYAREFAESVFRQIEGFGEYGFPESHAAGFALLAWVSSWIKRHHPDAFLAALLNSQPMGFYALAQLVRDAREHGVEVRPVDVAASEWESALEGEATVRLGFSRVAGLSKQAAERIVAARADGPWAGVEDLARRAALDAADLRRLAQADALRSLAGHRHDAAWSVAGIDARPAPLLRAARTREAPIALAAPSQAEDTLADYRALGLTLKRHPVALVREELARWRVRPAAALRDHPHGRRARASGLVTHRQRPPTAKGTVFVTLEDETGAVNVIVWPGVADAQRGPLLSAVLLTVDGVWQREGAVTHLIAARLIDHTALLRGLVGRSRDFR